MHTHHRLSFTATGLTLAAALAGGCLADAGDEGLATDDVATAEEAIQAGGGTAPIAGIIKIDVIGQADTHTGLLLSPGLVLTSGRWMSWQTTPSNVTATSGPGSSSPQVRTARFVNSSSYFPEAIAQVPPFTGGHANTVPIDTRSSAALLGVTLRCYEYVGNQLRWADMRVAAASGDDLTLAPVFGTVEDADAGAPCLDLSTYTAVAMVSSGPPVGPAKAHRLGGMQPWFDGMRNLFDTRNASSSSRLALYTIAPNGSQMCLDIPWGSPFDHEALNVYPCHFAPAQRFWLDYRVDAGRPRLVSDSSGRCADVPSSSLVSGTNYQQFGCHAGWNQRFELSIWNDAIGGWKLKPAHAPAQNLCLSVEGGPSNVSVPTEQRTCVGTQDQRWWPRWL